jgi:hypothetical protein
LAQPSKVQILHSPLESGIGYTIPFFLYHHPKSFLNLSVK